MTALLLPACALPQGFDDAAVLRFNLVCAQCHEGQCSGRLSFSGGPEAAFGHIHRFAGDVDRETGLRLHAVLAVMKRQCAYAPMTALGDVEAVQRARLDPYREPATGGYFVPLGRLEPVGYRLLLRLARPAIVQVEVVSASFEPVLDDCVGFADEPLALELVVEEPGAHYLRLRAKGGLRLEGLGLSPMGAGVAPRAPAARGE